jgi:hypothetical protein
MVFGADLINVREGMIGIALGDLEPTIPLGESLVPTPRDSASAPRPSARPSIFLVTFQIDLDLAEQIRAAGCPCGGQLHCANYDRKPRGGSAAIETDYAVRFSFCCDRCQSDQRRHRFVSSDGACISR